MTTSQLDPSFALRFQDAGNALPGIRRLKPLMLEQLALRRGLRVVELGCGAGDDARQLARRVGPGGHVLGIDAAPAMVAEARRRSAGRRLPVAFQVGDARALDLPDGSVDRVRIERLLMHVAGEPAAVIAEPARVLRPGGRIAVFDFDWDTLVVDGADQALTRRIVRSHCDALRNGCVGRALGRLLAEAGLAAMEMIPHAVALPFDFFSWLLSGHLDAMAAEEMLAADELIAWWDALDRAHARGGFYASLLGFVAVGAKPEAAGA